MARDLKVWVLGDGTNRRYIVAHSVAEGCRLVNADDSWMRWNCGPKHFKDYAGTPGDDYSKECLAKGVGIYIK